MGEWKPTDEQRVRLRSLLRGLLDAHRGRGYGLSEYQAEIICKHKPIADMFEVLVILHKYEPKGLANLFIQRFPRVKEIMGVR